MRSGRPRTPNSPPSSSAHATANFPTTLAWPAFNAENGSVATRDAGGTVMNAIAKALPELVGGSADLDPSTKTYLKGFGDFQPGTYGGRNIHFGVREHAMAAATNGIALHGGLLAVLRDLLQLSRLLQAGATTRGHQQDPLHLRVHPRLGVLGRRRPDASADRAARDAARDAELSSTFGRPTRSKRSKRGSSRFNRKPDPRRSCSRVKNCRSSATATPRSQGRVYPRRTSGHARLDPHRDAVRKLQLAVAAAKLLAAKGTQTRGRLDAVLAALR